MLVILEQKYFLVSAISSGHTVKLKQSYQHIPKSEVQQRWEITRSDFLSNVLKKHIDIV